MWCIAWWRPLQNAETCSSYIHKHVVVIDGRKYEYFLKCCSYVIFVCTLFYCNHLFFCLNLCYFWCVGMYKVVHIWPGQTVTCWHTISPGHIWTTLYVLITTVDRNIFHWSSCDMQIKLTAVALRRHEGDVLLLILAWKLKLCQGVNTKVDGWDW
jgi:hypothetical protein